MSAFTSFSGYFLNVVKLYLLKNVHFTGIHAQDFYFRYKENGHDYEELNHNPPHIMVRAAMSTRQLFHLFSPPVCRVSPLSYLAMLRDWFVPQLEHSHPLGEVWSQQDGAPPH